MDSFVLGTRAKVAGQNRFGNRTGAVSYLKVPSSAAEPTPSDQVSTVRT
ncbi:hypothetical protein PMI22_01181 [Pseudomonas sp. GM21]|nr:hypothetical protein PMI22_01181 [Pseudomonas sp. GM21]